MPNYEDCVIYTIRSGEHLYVGSTCNFVRRKCDHKNTIHNEKSKSYNLKLYKTIRENDDEWEMKPYGEFPCKNKMQMNIEEERVRRELNADLNSISCYGHKESSKQYRIVNKEKYADYMKQYNKQYRENNKEKYAEYMKQYIKENKDKLNQNQKVIVTCGCGCKITKQNILKHKKTNKHIKLLEEKQKINTDA